MPWDTQITTHDLLLAMHECDHYGVEQFRQLYGNYQAAHDLHMYYMFNTPNPRGPYEARPLIAAAWAHHVRNRNFAHNYLGGNINTPHLDGARAHEFLERQFGFTRRDI